MFNKQVSDMLSVRLAVLLCIAGVVCGGGDAEQDTPQKKLEIFKKWLTANGASYDLVRELALGAGADFRPAEWPLIPMLSARR